MLNKNELQVIKNKEYKFFVCDIYDGELNILSGWQYPEDARDQLQQDKADCELASYNVELKVYTRKTIKSLLNKRNK